MAILCRSAPRDALLAARFGVEQGLTEHGDVKVRPVDDLSASGKSCLLVLACLHWSVYAGVNGCCEQEEKLTNDGVGLLFQVAREFTEQVGEHPSLWKADIDSAYRRLPLKAADRLVLHPLLVSTMVIAQLHAMCQMGRLYMLHCQWTMDAVRTLGNALRRHWECRRLGSYRVLDRIHRHEAVAPTTS